MCQRQPPSFSWVGSNRTTTRPPQRLLSHLRIFSCPRTIALEFLNSLGFRNAALESRNAMAVERSSSDKGRMALLTVFKIASALEPCTLFLFRWLSILLNMFVKSSESQVKAVLRDCRVPSSGAPNPYLSNNSSKTSNPYPPKSIHKRSALSVSVSGPPETLKVETGASFYMEDFSRKNFLTSI